MNQYINQLPKELKEIISGYVYDLIHVKAFEQTIKAIDNIFPWTSIENIHNTILYKTNFMFTYRHIDDISVRDLLYGHSNQCTFYTELGELEFLED